MRMGGQRHGFWAKSRGASWGSVMVPEGWRRACTGARAGQIMNQVRGLVQRPGFETWFCDLDKWVPPQNSFL